MPPSPQLVQTGRTPARPRNVIAGILGVLVIMLSCGLCGRGVRSLDAVEAINDSTAVAP